MYGNPSKPKICPREPSTYDQISWGLGGIAAKPSGILFSRGVGIVNSNPYIRIGWGWKGTRQAGYEIFRIAIVQKGSRFHWHFDFWDLFRR